ncbi:multidrug effflux MFS transporter [Streptomyces sp. NPDC020875]|uniref:multidrug effflux MFS transporter n=1 Tax=Streptomyces sp. NPDC020875 TaxID=3154898 RepID=UPI0033F6E9E6
MTEGRVPEIRMLPEPERHAIPQGKRRRIVVVLGGLAALPPLSMDMYIPALPEVSRALSTPASSVQLTLSACVVGLAVGQLLVGPLSDRWGRRRPLIIGMLVFTLATAACAMTNSIETLVAWRLIQGLAGSSGIVLSRAIVCDLFEGAAMARFFSALMLASGAATIGAPVLGGQILRGTDWRGIFIALAVLGLLLTLGVWKWLRETSPGKSASGRSNSGWFRTTGELLSNRSYVGYVLTNGLAFSALFACVAASSFVYQEIFGASAQTYSLMFGISSLGLVAAGQLNGRVLIRRWSLDRVLLAGIVAALLSSAALFGMAMYGIEAMGLVPTACAMVLLMASMGLIFPNANALALADSAGHAGSASALLGSAQYLLGAIVSPIVGIAGEDTALPMAVVQLTVSAAALLTLICVCRPCSALLRRDGDRPPSGPGEVRPATGPNHERL